MTSKSNGDERWPRVVVAMPKERVMPNCGHMSMVKIAQRGYPIMDLPYARTDVARNQFAEDLLESAFTHIVMLDSDHEHPDDIVENLLRWVILDKTRLVIATATHRRGAPYDVLMFLPDGDGGMYSPVDYPEGLLRVRNEYGPGIVGTGAILIAREVFEKLEWPWFAYEYPKQGHYPTEDVYFSKKCNAAGIDLWVDTTISCPHLTDSYITKQTHDDYIAAHPEMVDTITRMEVVDGS